MKKSLFSVLFFYLVCGFMFTPKIIAQDAAQSQRWVCLGATKTGNKFKQSLKAKADLNQRPLPSTQTYIVECVTTSQGQKCTTGHTDADQTVYGQNNLQILTKALKKDKVNYTFDGMFKSDGKTAASNPLMSDATGDIGGVIWGSHSAHQDRRFLAMNFWTPTEAGTPGGAGALQQGTFTFNLQSAAKSCAAIHWDPYGRVFDSQTLEPVPNVSVTLFFKKGSSFVKMTPADILGGDIVNPQITEEDGGFSFVIPDGDYKLAVSPFSLLSNAAQIDPSYTKAYSEIYPFVPADVGGVIHEVGAIEHRDIPIATIGSNTPVKIMGYSYTADPTSGDAIIEGIVSQPFAIITAKSAKIAKGSTVEIPYRDIGTTSADKMGNFSLEIDQSKLEKTADYIEVFSDVVAAKVDMKTVAQKQNTFIQKIALFFKKLVPNVLAQGATASIHVEPIPRYLEGYAYVNGVVTPNATVQVFETMSNKAYSTVKADNTGYFKITSEYLPTDPYELRIMTPQGTTADQSTSQFIAANQKTITENNIDIYSYRNQQNKTATDLITPTSSAQNGGERNGINPGGGSSNTQSGGQSNTASTSPLNNPIFQYLGIIAAIVILVVIAVVAVIMIKRQSPPPSSGMIQ